MTDTIDFLDKLTKPSNTPSSTTYVQRLHNYIS